MKIIPAIALAALSILLSPENSFASVAIDCSRSDPQTEVFEKYHSYTDQMIKRDCTYDMQRIEPRATRAELNENARRTAGCVHGVTRMRDISRDYMGQRKNACANARQPTSCAAGSSQAGCLLGAGKLAANAQQSEAGMGNMLADAKKEMEELKRYRRLRSRGYREDLATLKGIPREEKINSTTKPRRDLHARTSPQTNNSNPTHNPPMPERKPSSITDSRPQPGKLDRPIFESQYAGPPDGSITDPGDGYSLPPEIDAREGGVRTLAEYEDRLPNIIREQEENLRRMEEFERATTTKQTEHKAAASQLALQAAKLFQSAKEFGVVDDEMAAWETANPEVVRAVDQAAQTQAPGRRIADAENAFRENGANLSESPETDGEKNPESRQAKAADEAAKESSLAFGSAEAGEEKDAVLDSFETRLTVVDPKAPVRERSRLRDLLRQKLAGMKASDAAKESTAPAELVKELLAETKESAGRDPASASDPEKRGLGRLDVDGAIADMEAQLRELDFQAGILEAGSENLFARVSRVVKASYKSGALTAD